MAQTGSVSPAPPTPDRAALGDIVVTAQRREQTLQDVPAVNAITADRLEARGGANVTDVIRVSPSLTIAENTNATGSSVNLRGIGTFSFSIAIEPSVAIVAVDDVALLRQAQALPGLTDIARLAVLRGPQGALFGKNAAAGVITIQGLTSTLTCSVGAVATADDRYRVEGMISGPVAKDVGFRLNAFYDERDGYVRGPNTATSWLADATTETFAAFTQLYAFGHRLSYTGFAYSDWRLRGAGWAFSASHSLLKNGGPSC